MRTVRPIIIALVCLLLSGVMTTADQTAVIDAAKAKRLEWFHQAKYGLFIHWGLYAIPAGQWKGRRIPGIGEWIMNRAQIPVKEYEQLARQFNPIKFNAEEQYNLRGLYTISEEKLARLDGDSLFKLNSAGFLQGAFLVIASHNNVKKLIDLKHRRRRRQAELA